MCEDIEPTQGEWPCQRPALQDEAPRLVSLLYLLVRDELPAGRLEEMLIQIRRDDEEVGYTNLHLEGLARAHARYLLEVSP